MIETRGGGYAIIPPTPGYCHPTGRMYEYLTARTLAEVQRITTEERDTLFRISRAFDEMPTPAPRRKTPRHDPSTSRARADRPGDDFNVRATWPEILEEAGWSFDSSSSDDVDYWTRPGKEDGVSASVNYGGTDLLHVFTSNAAPLEQDANYSKFSFVTVVKHDGDFSAASKALRRLGYGVPELPAGRRGQADVRSRPRTARARRRR